MAHVSSPIQDTSVKHRFGGTTCSEIEAEGAKLKETALDSSTRAGRPKKVIPLSRSLPKFRMGSQHVEPSGAYCTRAFPDF